MKHVCTHVCVLACSVILTAQSDLPKHVLQLAQLKRYVQARVTELQNYTCVETIERSQRKRVQQPFRNVDTLHVEVAVVHDRELYSWPGANQFEDRNVTEFVGAGTISSGSFASYIGSAIVDNVSVIQWHGADVIFDRHSLRWDYRIPYNLSGWTLQSGKSITDESEKYWTIPIPGVSTFFVDAAEFRLPERLHMSWRTRGAEKMNLLPVRSR